MTTARQQTLVVTEKRLQHEVIVAEPPQRAIVAAGQQGPAGPSGLAEGLPTDPLAYYILARS